MRYKILILAVFAFLLPKVAECDVVQSELVLQSEGVSSALKSFFHMIAVCYPKKNFAVCLIADGLHMVVADDLIEPVDAFSVIRSVDDLSQAGVIESSEPAVSVPLTAFHVANMSAGTGYTEIPRPAKIVVKPKVFNRPQDQQNSPTPQGKLRPSVANSPWRTVFENQVLVWFFVTPLQAV